MPAPKTSVTLSQKILTEIDRRVEFDDANSRSAVIDRHLERYFDMLARARRELRQLFSDSETMLIVDTLNGVGFWDTMAVYMVAHEVADAIEMDGLDAKWKVDGPALLTKLANLSAAQSLALVDSVTLWWNRVGHGEQPEHTAEVVFADPKQGNEI